MRPEFGMGLQGVIAARGPVVSGILNGVDTDVWSTRGARSRAYSAEGDGGQGRGPRGACARSSGWRCRGRWPSSSAGLTDQKGIDLLPAVMPGFRRWGAAG